MEKESGEALTVTIIRKTVCCLLTLLALLVIWTIGAKVVSSPLILPAPETVANSFLELFGQKSFLLGILFTFLRVLVAFIISAVAGVLLGALCSFFKTFRDVMEILLSVMRSLPFVSIILLSLFWLDSSTVPVLCAVLMALPVVVTAGTQGFLSFSKEDRAFVKMTRLSHKGEFILIRLPKAFPFISQSLKSAAGMIWKVVVSGEVLSIPRKALGSMLQDSRVALETTRVFALTIVVVVLGYLSSILLIGLEKLLIKIYRTLVQKRFSSEKFNKPYRNFMQRKGIASFDVEDLTVNRPHELYKNFSYSFKGSKVYAITGTSGAGKTTFLDYLSGDLEDSSVITGKKYAATNKTGGGEQRIPVSAVRYAYLFQSPYLVPSLTVLQNILLMQKCYGRGAYQDAQEILKGLCLEKKAASFPSSLSGGQKQRAALAMVLSSNADVYLFDEGLKSQDKETYGKCIKTLNQLLQEKVRDLSCGSLAIMVTHSSEEAALLGAEIIEI